MSNSTANHNVSAFKASTIGMYIGTTIIIIDNDSMNVPIKRTISNITKMITIELYSILLTTFTRLRVTPENDNICPNIAEPATIIRIIVVSSKVRSEEHTSELQSRFDLVCRLLLEKKKK